MPASPRDLPTHFSHSGTRHWPNGSSQTALPKSPATSKSLRPMHTLPSCHLASRRHSFPSACGCASPAPSGSSSCPCGISILCSLQACPALQGPGGLKPIVFRDLLVPGDLTHRCGFICRLEADDPKWYLASPRSGLSPGTRAVATASLNSLLRGFMAPALSSASKPDSGSLL